MDGYNHSSLSPYLHSRIPFLSVYLRGFHLDLFLVQNSGLPWVTPKSPLSLSSITDAIASALGVCISFSIY